MKLPVFAIALLLGTTDVLAGGPVIPDGWRLPSEKELGDEWRSGEYKNAEVIGDFNGDGLIEGAFLAVSTDGKDEGLLAFVYQGGKEKWFVLDKVPFNGTVFMGLDKYPPGKYKVLCDTDAECARGHKKQITLNSDSFVYYRPESASSIFVWSSAKGGFVRIWESD